MPEVADGLFAAPLQVERVPDRFGLPPRCRYEQVRMPARAGAVDPLAPAVQLAGAGGPDPAVRIAAAVATWCGEDAGQLIVRRASARDLAARGAPVLSLAALGVVPAQLLDLPGCPLRRIEEDEPVRWCRGQRHGRDGAEAGWVPYGQVPVAFRAVYPEEPLAHPTNHSGLAAGPDDAAALDRACAAVLAEDAAVRWWEGGSGTPQPAGPLLVRHPGVRVQVRHLPDRFGGRVALAMASSFAGADDVPIVTFGAAATDDAAAARALWQHVLARTLHEDPSAFAGGTPEGILEHRADRSYRASGVAGLRRGSDPLASLQAGLDPVSVEHAVRRFAALPATASAPIAARDHLQALLRGGAAVWSVDLTTADVRPTGWRCFRVLVPGLRRVDVPAFCPHAAALPYPGW